MPITIPAMAPTIHDAIVECLARKVQMSGAALTAALRMPRSTFAAAIAQLEAQDTVVQVGLSNGGRGRPSYLYRLKLPKAVMSLQVEGTQLAGAVFDRTLQLQALEVAPLRNVQSVATALEACKVMSAKLLSRSGARDQLAGVAISLNAVQTGRRIVASSVLPWVTDDLDQQLSHCLQLPVRIWIQSHLSAEYQRLRVMPRSVVLFHAADGISANMIVNAHSHTGHSGMAGELGHVSREAGGPLCGCGKRGCLEAYCSGPAIHRRMAEDLATGVLSLLEADTFLRVAPPEAMELVWLAWQAGDSFARTFMAEVLGRLGWGLGLVQNLLDPQVIVFGGYVLAARLPWVDEIRRASHTWLLRPVDRKTQFVQATASIEDALRLTAISYYHPAKDTAGGSSDAAN